MMENKGFGRPKTKEELQTQVEQFAEIEYSNLKMIKPEKFNSEEDENIFYEKYLQSMKDQSEMLVYSAELSEIQDFKNLPVDIDPKLKGLIERNRDAYVEFCDTEMKALDYYRASKVKIYNEKYKSRVNDIKDQIKNGIPLEEIPGYVNKGTKGAIFFTDDKHSKVVKLYSAIHDGTSSSNVGKNEILSLLRAKDIENVSHLEGYSYEDRAVIMEYIEGKNLKELTKKERVQLSDEEIKSVFKIIFDLYQNGLEIDPHPTNFIYNKEKGFSVIDYHLLKNPENFMYLLRSLPENLSRRKNTSDEESDYDQFSDLEPRIVKILEEDYPEFCEKHKEHFEKWKSMI